jgi:hypothetical protein
MASAVDFLKDIETDGGEAWKPDHKTAMQCRDLEDFLKKAINKFNLIRSADEEWSRRVEAGSATFDPAFAKELHRLYEWWMDLYESGLDGIALFEKRRYPVEGANEFRDAFFTATSILRTPVEMIIEAMLEDRE